MTRWLVVFLAATVSVSAHAQLTRPVRNNETTILVTGNRDAKVKMSKWRAAETPHVVVFGEHDEKRLGETARNLETLHFLLSTFLGRLGAPDDTIKIAVTMIGDIGAFEQMQLTELRWQYGPFPERFAKMLYYDPREEGSVLATPRDGVNLVLSPSRGRATNRNCDGTDDGIEFLPPVHVNYRVDPMTGELKVDENQILAQMSVNELTFCQSAESRLYSGFAQNYLLTYFPAAYPRWFLQGFGEIFATLKTGDDFVEYGRVPKGYSDVIKHYGRYPVTHVLGGQYLSGTGRHWTPYHAWQLVHLLYFSDEWKPRLHEYLNALAQGADPQTATSALGDPAQLQRALNGYRGRKVQSTKVTFPSELVPEPIIRRLTRAEAALIRGRLELGARVEIPDGDDGERTAALARREAWLTRLRENAQRYPDRIEHQLLLAEAECRTGHAEECLAAAERALARSPKDTTAMVWKGTALAQLAVRGPATERENRLKEARQLIVQANRMDPQDILPIIAYHQTFVIADEPTPDIAMEGMAKVVVSAPASPTSRLKLGQELIKRDLKDATRITLLPVAKGPFNTPEQPTADLLLKEAMASAPDS
jgi:hypothetical protein